MSDDLIAFLRARLDDDAAVARRASDWATAGWSTEAHSPTFEGDEAYEWADLLDGDGGEMVGNEADLPKDVADHIARHDPARVQAEVEAKRLILAEHNTWQSLQPDDPHHWSLRYPNCCVGCGLSFDEETPLVEDVNECTMLRAIAHPYSNHPSYREEWRP